MTVCHAQVNLIEDGKKRGLRTAKIKLAITYSKSVNKIPVERLDPSQPPKNRSTRVRMKRKNLAVLVGSLSVAIGTLLAQEKEKEAKAEPPKKVPIETLRNA